MSIAAMNWVWSLRLKPTPKFVLLALADAADDKGYCWPSVPTLARKTCLDDRSVQRILGRLKAEGLLQVQQRFRKDGSPTSNGYRLPLTAPGDKLPPPPPVLCPDLVSSASPRSGSGVTLTTTEYINEPKPPQPITDTGSSGLIFPKQLSPKEVSLAKSKLESLPLTQAQELLDELAGRLNAHSVRGSPLSYLRSLVTRAEAGTFTPEIGIRVALARQRESELSALRQSESSSRSARSTNSREHLENLRKVFISTSHSTGRSNYGPVK